jgi:7-carboxy-7-deazaguanine synthase
MYVKEIEFSINGEINKFLQGSPALFVRFAGCNFHNHPCRWCDTPNSLVANDSTMKTIPFVIRNTIISKSSFNFNPIVVLTGGEPLMQDHNEMVDLITNLEKYNVVIETNGSISPIKFLLPHVNIVMDFKTPSSGNSKYMKLENFKYLRKDDIIKFPVENEEDLEYAFYQAATLSKTTECIKAISPIFGGDNEVPISDFAMKAAKEGLYVSVQLHKLINVY